MKPLLLLLHGAIGSKTQLSPLAEVLKDKFEIHSLNFSGHGGEPIPDAEFSIRLFAEEVNRHLAKKNISKINIFGYSMGGYVALYLAKYFPESVNKIFTLATKFDWNMAGAEKESKMLVPEKIEEKVPDFAKQLKERHSPQDWKIVLNKTADMMLEMGKTPPLTKDDFRSISNKVLLAVGDKDRMVSPEETKKAASFLPDSAYVLLKDAPHPIEQVSTAILHDQITQFFLSYVNQKQFT